jgi:hypothetical protein
MRLRPDGWRLARNASPPAPLTLQQATTSRNENAWQGPPIGLTPPPSGGDSFRFTR